MNLLPLFFLLADLSSYTPKHGVDFSSWQEQKLDDPTFLSNPESREPSAKDVMVSETAIPINLHFQVTEYYLEAILHWGQRLKAQSVTMVISNAVSGSGPKKGPTLIPLGKLIGQ